MPGHVGLRSAFAQVRCDHCPEMVHPAPNGLVGDHDAPLRQQIFDVAKAQCEPEIEPDRLLDDLRREPVPFAADCLHSPGYLTAREAASQNRRDNPLLWLRRLFWWSIWTARFSSSTKTSITRMGLSSPIQSSSIAGKASPAHDPPPQQSASSDPLANRKRIISSRAFSHSQGQTKTNDHVSGMSTLYPAPEEIAHGWSCSLRQFRARATL